MLMPGSDVPRAAAADGVASGPADHRRSGGERA